ncbi:transporter substrate-binding domain-containing protein [Caballeronia cordobensis]|uniref:transporter substrate-binding domain-containing protein n=1 Tax=Caballeronia cordobensis TaxID=1353886 RepID=UPI00045EEAA8|nr:putative membrane protein [Burkholderia sp. RPE67]
MKGSKFLLAILAITTLVAQPQARAEANSDDYWKEVQKKGVLRCGAASAPPYVIRDAKTAQYSGIFVDLCRQFAHKTLGVKVEIVDTTWESIVAGLQANRWDLSLAVNRTPQRESAIAFSHPAWGFEIGAVYDKANPKFTTAPKSLEDVDRTGTTIAVVSGTASDQILTARVHHAALLRLLDVDVSRLSLMAHRADIIFDDAALNASFAKNDPQRWVIMQPSPVIAKQGIAFGLRRNVTDADLQTLNRFIDNSQTSGQVQALGRDYQQRVAAVK